MEFIFYLLCSPVVPKVLLHKRQRTRGEYWWCSEHASRTKCFHTEVKLCLLNLVKQVLNSSGITTFFASPNSLRLYKLIWSDLSTCFFQQKYEIQTLSTEVIKSPPNHTIRAPPPVIVVIFHYCLYSLLSESWEGKKKLIRISFCTFQIFISMLTKNGVGKWGCGEYKEISLLKFPYILNFLIFTLNSLKIIPVVLRGKKHTLKIKLFKACP